MSLPDFVWDWVKLAEGGFAHVAGDAGGRTQYGIAQAWNPQEWADGRVTEEEARAAYAQKYWTAQGCDRIPPALGLLCFDLFIQHPPLAAGRLWQRAIQEKPLDGVIGESSIRTAQRVPISVVQERYFPMRVIHYLDLIRADSTLLKFREGWMGRLFKLQRYLLAVPGR
jgi:lysozyme family protein